MVIKIGIIGCGYWGPNYIRILNELKDSDIKYVCDLNENSFKKISHYPNIIKVTDYNEILRDPEIDAVIVVTPIVSHYDIAKKVLESNKHILIEKPLTLNSEQSLDLIRISKEKNKTLMVAHTFIYNDAINELKKRINNKEEFGRILHAHSSRTGLGPIRNDVNSLWDLATHDIAIFLHLFDEKPISVSASGACYLRENIEDISYINIEFPNNKTINIHASWIYPKKIREITVVGSKKMILFNDISPEKLTIYDKGVENIDGVDESLFDLSLREGDIIIPCIKVGEPLKNQVKHFLECIKEGKNPISGGYNGYLVIKILESAQESINNGGKKVYLNFNDG